MDNYKQKSWLLLAGNTVERDFPPYSQTSGVGDLIANCTITSWKWFEQKAASSWVNCQLPMYIIVCSLFTGKGNPSPGCCEQTTVGDGMSVPRGARWACPGKREQASVFPGNPVV